jgi:hypothetical protein
VEQKKKREQENRERKSKEYPTATIPRQPRHLLNAVAQPKKNHKTQSLDKNQKGMKESKAISPPLKQTTGRTKLQKSVNLRRYPSIRIQGIDIQN